MQNIFTDMNLNTLKQTHTLNVANNLFAKREQNKRCDKFPVDRDEKASIWLKMYDDLTKTLPNTPYNRCKKP
jgi:hypothetical protein